MHIYILSNIMTTFLENDWLRNVRDGERNVRNVRAPRSCSFCRNTQHTIQSCSSIYIERELKQMETHINDSIVGMVTNLTNLTTSNTFDTTRFTDSIRKTILSWLKNYNRTMLMAMCYRKVDQLNGIYGFPHISSHMPRATLEHILVYMYSAIITDAINFHSGTITDTFRVLVANALLAELKDMEYTEHVELDTMEYFSHMRSLLFYKKRLSQIQLLDILLFMKNDRAFSYHFLALGEEKCLRIRQVIRTIQTYLETKYKKSFVGIQIEPEWIPPTEGAPFDCPVCLESHLNKTEIRLNCGHVYCSACIFTTIDSNLRKNTVPPCPLCRSNITKVGIQEQDIYDAFVQRFPYILPPIEHSAE